MFSVQEAIDIVRNNQFANGPRYEQAWKVLEAAVLATKLPLHAEVFAHVDNSLHIVGEREHAVLSAAYGFIERQLRAGA